MIWKKCMHGNETVLFIGGSVINYDYGRNTDDIVQFLNNNTPKLLLTDEDVKIFKKSSNKTIIASFNHSNEIWKIYLSIYKLFGNNRVWYECHHIPFGYIVNESIVKSNAIQFSSLVIYTNFENYLWIRFKK